MISKDTSGVQLIIQHHTLLLKTLKATFSKGHGLSGKMVLTSATAKSQCPDMASYPYMAKPLSAF